LASSFVGVVGQRLVRKICPSSVVHYEPTSEERELYKHFGDTAKEKFVHAVGATHRGS